MTTLEEAIKRIKQKRDEDAEESIDGWTVYETLDWALDQLKNITPDYFGIRGEEARPRINVFPFEENDWVEFVKCDTYNDIIRDKNLEKLTGSIHYRNLKKVELIELPPKEG